MTRQEALDYLHFVSWKGSVPGLSRTVELLRRMGQPQNRLKFIHIAGTNGKGSTAAMLSNIFRQAGYVTGLFSSPFLHVFNEQMQVNGKMISDSELAEIVEFVKPLAQTMDDQPTQFELVTAIAMEFFDRRNCDIVILEVGMGGESDSTNIISTPEAAVLTNIGLDHVPMLGSTVEQIAQNKAGIIKGGDAVVYPTDGTQQVIRARCEQTGTALHFAPFDTLRLQKADLSGQIFDCDGRTELFLPLLGEHQLKNAAVALKTVDVLRQKGWRLPETAIYNGLAQTKWPGRFELLQKEPLFLVDGGHNVQCMQALAQNLQTYLPNRGITALTGVMADKDYLAMYRIVAPYVSRWITVTPNNPRALSAEALAETLRTFGKPTCACATVEDGVREALRQTAPDEAVVAFGSLYMVGAIRDAVQ